MHTVPEDRKPYPHPDRPGVFVVPLTSGRVAFVAAGDAERVGRYVWSWTRDAKDLNDGHACRQYGRRGKATTVILGRFVIRAAPTDRVEYIDGNPLNCSRANLRLVPKRAPSNGRARKWRRPTSSRFKGVCLYRSGKSWFAAISVNYRSIHLGTFQTEEAAAMAYDDAAREHYGPQARLNFPD